MKLRQLPCSICLSVQKNNCLFVYARNDYNVFGKGLLRGVYHNLFRNQGYSEIRRLISE